MKTVKARGNTKIILDKVSEIQLLIGQAKQGYLNDQSRERAELVLRSLEKAFEKCLEIRDMYDPT